MYDGILYCNAQQGMYESYCIESQLRVNGGDWLDAYTANPDWIFSDTRATYVPGYDLKETDLVELRVRLTCEPLGLVSPWSNVLGSKPTFQAHAWATAELEEAYALGLIPDSLKDADLTKPITRAEFAAVSVKVYEALTGVKAEPVAQNPFTDCSDPEVLKALNVGITNGTNKEGTTFSPNVLLNREQAATMLARVYKKVVFDGWTLETDSAYNDQFRALFTMPDLFPDDAKISGWAKDSVYFMAANGIINGKADKNDGGVLKFFPKVVTDAEKALGYAQATREAALLIAVRMVKNLGE